MAAALILGIGLFWANSNDNDKSKPANSGSIVQVSQDDSDIGAVIFDVVQEQLAYQEEEELFALLEPLYTEDAVELWDENDEINSYMIFDGT